MEDATPDGLSHRANLMVNKGWVVKFVECHPARWWLGKDKWVALLVRDVQPEIIKSDASSLSINVGPVTLRS
jgi:hypothetical protein